MPPQVSMPPQDSLPPQDSILPLQQGSRLQGTLASSAQAGESSSWACIAPSTEPAMHHASSGVAICQSTSSFKFFPASTLQVRPAQQAAEAALAQAQLQPQQAPRQPCPALQPALDLRYCRPPSPPGPGPCLPPFNSQLISSFPVGWAHIGLWMREEGKRPNHAMLLFSGVCQWFPAVRP